MEGYIDASNRVNEKRDEQAKESASNGLKLFDRNGFAYKSSAFGDESNLDYRPTLEGLLIGEVLTEINNKKTVLKYWNRYKYNWVLDTVWFLAFFGLLKLLLPSNAQQQIEAFKINFLCIPINYLTMLMLTVFIFWPFLSFLYRKIYSKLEG